MTLYKDGQLVKWAGVTWRVEINLMGEVVFVGISGNQITAHYEKENLFPIPTDDVIFSHQCPYCGEWAAFTQDVKTLKPTEIIRAQESDVYLHCEKCGRGQIINRETWEKKTSLDRAIAEITRISAEDS